MGVMKRAGRALWPFVNRHPWVKGGLVWLLDRFGHGHARAHRLSAGGDWVAAARLWRRLAQGMPPESDAEAQANAWVEYGRCCLQLGRLADARDALQQAQALRPDWVLPGKLLGWVAAEQRDWPLAARQWQAALDDYDRRHKGAEGDGRLLPDATAARYLPAGAASNLAELLECLKSLAVACIHLGRFADAEPLIERLADSGGWRLALELRLQVAQLRFDEEGQAEALARLRAAPAAPSKKPAAPNKKPAAPGKAPPTGEPAGDSPQAAAGAALASRTPPSLTSRGRWGSDTQEDLLRETDPERALGMLAALGQVSASERLALSRQLAQRFPDAMEVQLSHLWQIADCLGSADELDEFQTRAKDFCGRWPEHPRRWWLEAQAAVLARDPEAAAPLAEAALARLGEHDEALQLRLWLAAQRGDQDEAYRLAEALRGRAYSLAEDGAGLDLRPLTRPPRAGAWQRRRDRLLVFACLRNEHAFAPWFLAHYRALGVERFFIVDNGSTDGTAEYLCQQKDVTVFASADKYARAHSGIRWINELIRRYGEDNWCVHVDADEQLLLPPPHSTLRQFVDEMAARGEEALPAYLLDTYPAQMAAARAFRHGDRPLDAANLIDPDHYFFGGIRCCFLRARGGVRDRLFGSRTMIDKVPVLRGGKGRLYRDAHKVSYARVSSQCAVLLHHKLLRDLLDMQQPEAEAALRVQDRLAGHQATLAAQRASGLLDPAKDLPRGPDAVECQDAAQLQALLAARGLLGPAPLIPAPLVPAGASQ